MCSTSENVLCVMVNVLCVMVHVPGAHEESQLEADNTPHCDSLQHWCRWSTLLCSSFESLTLLNNW
jgi:hypothetical protein